MFVVNAPFLFAGVWAIVKSFLDEKTRKKIKIIGGSFKPTLLEYVEPHVLPDFLGGTCVCTNEGGCMTSNIGPWNDYEMVEPIGIVKKGEKPDSEEEKKDGDEEAVVDGVVDGVAKLSVEAKENGEAEAEAGTGGEAKEEAKE